MPSNSAAQAQQNQQNNQNQAEQFLAAQRQQAETAWSNFFKSNPDPASTWGKIAPPSFAGAPSYIGGSGRLKDAVGSAPPPKAQPAKAGKSG
jgi:hypothetical protein